MSHATLITLGLLSGVAIGADYSVPGDFPAIQEAVNAASAGDVINVGPGTWPGRLDFRGKDLTVRSTSGAEVTIIDSNGIGSTILFQTEEGPGRHPGRLHRHRGNRQPSRG